LTTSSREHPGHHRKAIDGAFATESRRSRHVLRLGNCKRRRGSERGPSIPAKVSSPHEPGLAPRWQHGLTVPGSLGLQQTASDKCIPVTLIKCTSSQNGISSICVLTSSIFAIAFALYHVSWTNSPILHEHYRCFGN
jgi:hypothetical protein